MTGKQHLAIGIVSSTGLSICTSMGSETFNPALTGLFVMGSAIGSLLPDIDIPNSTISHRCFFLAKMLKKYYCSLGTAFGNDKYIAHISQHRGICHSFSACLATLALIFPWLPHILVAGIALGFVLHILCDCTTITGVMLWAPFSIKFYGGHKIYINTPNNVSKANKTYINVPNSVSKNTIILSTVLYIINLSICLLTSYSALFMLGILAEAYLHQDILIPLLFVLLLVSLQLLLRWIRPKIGNRLHCPNE